MSPDVRNSGSRWQSLLKFFCLVLLIVGGNLAADELAHTLQLEIRPANEDLAHRMIMTAAVTYTLLMAVPFVPGVEIGLAMIIVLGPAIVFLVYLCTVVALTMSFAIGRLVPFSALIKLFADFRLNKASQLFSTIAPMTGEDRLVFLISSSPNRYVPFLLRHRYIALAILVNLPGNVLIGGGGGIALMAGASRLYSLPWFLLTILLAVSPVPLAVLIFGKDILR